jgi:hypothetical protein
MKFKLAVNVVTNSTRFIIATLHYELVQVYNCTAVPRACTPVPWSSYLGVHLHQLVLGTSVAVVHL